MISVPNFLTTWVTGKVDFWRRNVIFTSQKSKTINSVIVSRGGEMVHALLPQDGKATV